DQRLPVRAIEDEKLAIPRGLREQLARLSIEIRVKENSRLRRVPVVRIVRRRLEVPAHLSVIRIERHDLRREEIGARAIDVRDDRLRVPARDVQVVQVWE